MKKIQNVKGFTLVEISIVLVIIAILLAAVIGGLDLIKSAKRNAVIAEVNELKIAIKNFQMKYYDELPGDFPDAQKLWGTVTDDGNGDGEINKTPSDNLESLHSWQHLNLAGMLEGNYTGELINSNFVPGGNVPQSSYDTHIGYQLFETHVGNYEPVFGRTGNLMSFGSCRAGISTNVCRGVAIKPVDAYNIDQKIDDGLADDGDVRTANGHNNADAVVSTCSANSNAASGSYQLNQDVISCVMLFYFD